MATKVYQLTKTKEQVEDVLTKVLTPDATPTEDSTNLVTSGGVYEAIDAKVVLYPIGFDDETGKVTTPLNTIRDNYKNGIVTLMGTPLTLSINDNASGDVTSIDVFGSMYCQIDDGGDKVPTIIYGNINQDLSANISQVQIGLYSGQVELDNKIIILNGYAESLEARIKALEDKQ